MAAFTARHISAWLSPSACPCTTSFRKGLGREVTQACSNEIRGLNWRRQVVFHHVVEAADKRVVQVSSVVGCRDDQAVRRVLLDHLQKAVQDPANLAHIIRHAPLGTDGVKLIEKRRHGYR